MRRRTALVALAALAGTWGGCFLSEIGPDTCDRSEAANPAVRFTAGAVQDGIYMSSAWDGELLYFPGGMRYEIEHKLGTVPRLLQFYLSFDRGGTSTGVLAHAAGNQAELRAINETTLTVVNGSCVDYWLLVVAAAEAALPEPPAGDDAGAPDADAGAQ